MSQSATACRSNSCPKIYHHALWSKQSYCPSEQCIQVGLCRICVCVGCKERHDLPWCASPTQLEKVRRCCEQMRANDDVLCLPLGIASVRFENSFGAADFLKSAEYLLHAGPTGQYTLEECFSPAVQKVVFEYLHLIGLLCRKTSPYHSELFGTAHAHCAHTVLPSLELDMNRHTMAHLVRPWSMLGLVHVWFREVLVASDHSDDSTHSL